MNLPINSTSFDRRGISLLEVMISIGLLAIGLTSVLALVAAGRELNAKVRIQTQALAMAQRSAQQIAPSWLDTSQWVGNNMGTWEWVSPNTNSFLSSYTLPLLIDPTGLASDTLLPQNRKWTWNHSCYHYPNRKNLNDPNNPDDDLDKTFQYPRLTLAGDNRIGHTVSSILTPPLTREQMLSEISSPDALEYYTATDPPQNRFENGRRKRASDFTVALFLAPANRPTSIATTDVTLSLNSVDQWLLVFHKRLVDHENISAPTDHLAFSGNCSGGGVELINDLLDVDRDTLNRALYPTKWMLVVCKYHLYNSNTQEYNGPTRWDLRWIQILSVIAPPLNKPKDLWFVTFSDDLPEAWESDNGNKIYAFTYESLKHVEGPSRVQLY